MAKASFLRAWLAAPLKIGAIAPSSPTLCRTMAAHALRDNGCRTVLELGSGTGEITQALVKGGVAPENLYLIELLPEFCNVLRNEFPAATVLEGDVTVQLTQLATHADNASVDAIVSSLPIVWFPLEHQRIIVDCCFKLLKKSGRFLQLTYLPTSPLPMKKLGLRGDIVARVWRNSIPACLWSYSNRGLDQTRLCDAEPV